MKEKAKVILRRADAYNPSAIAKIIGDGLAEFGLAPRIQGKITIKPNVVMAHHKVTPSAYTRPEFLDGLLTALEEKAQGEPEITVAEKCGAAIPTSRMFRRAGYYRLRKKHRFKLRPIEEARKKTVRLEKGKVHRKVRTSREIAERDFLIYAPKLKTNALAHDVVCAHIFHLDPEKIGHLAAARARGYGSLDLGDIEIDGDISLQEIRERTKTWETGFIRADDVDCNIKIRSGEPYCTGGCHGVFLDWLYMIRDRKPKLWAKLPAWTAVIGKYKGDITANRLLLIGACTEIEGRVKAKRKVRIRGCPPKHKTLVLLLFLRAGIINPLFRFDLIIDSYPFLFWTWFKRFITGRF